jgi:hypothetical protein
VSGSAGNMPLRTGASRYASAYHAGLGFNLDRVSSEYGALAQGGLEYLRSVQDEDDDNIPEFMSFEEFRSFVTAHPLGILDDTAILDFDSASEAKIRGRFDAMRLDRIPCYNSYENQAYSERGFFVGLIEFLHPYSVLRLLAEGEANADLPVVWQYGPLVQAGWATDKEFVPHARRNETFLIATEGSSS